MSDMVLIFFFPASESALNLDCVLSLLALFLLNVRFVDQAVTPATCSQVAALMEDTESKVLKGLLTASLMGNSKVEMILNLFNAEATFVLSNNNVNSINFICLCQRRFSVNHS